MTVVEIPITKGFVTLVNEDDLHLLPHLDKWHATGSKGFFYATTNHKDENGRYPTKHLHHYILPPRPGLFVDHINGDRMDNRRENLRYVTASQNQYNRKPKRGCSSKYKGVAYKKRKAKTKPWEMSIRFNGKSIWRSFANEEDAARAYDRLALEFFGEYARTNFPREDYETEQLPLAA